MPSHSPCGSPWFEWLSFPCFIGFEFLTPTNRGLYLVVVGGGGGGGWWVVVVYSDFSVKL